MSPPLGRVVLAAVLLWGVGLGLFTLDALRPSAPAPLADAIVVPTGDALRVQTALALLAAGRARLLLISGTGPHASLRQMLRQGAAPREIGGRVTLGRDAVSTWGNGAEFAAWARRHRVGSAIVVTSFYHMRRALLEIGRAAPEVRLAAVKVPQNPKRALVPADLRKLVSDYDKYLLALIGLSRFSPGHSTL